MHRYRSTLSAFKYFTSVNGRMIFSVTRIQISPPQCFFQSSFFILANHAMRVNPVFYISIPNRPAEAHLCRPVSFIAALLYGIRYSEDHCILSERHLFHEQVLSWQELYQAVRLPDQNCLHSIQIPGT